MKYYLIAGEASGDLHGANLMEEIKKNDSKAEFRFWGGDKMLQQGGVRVKHYKTYDHMGFVEVIKHLRTILKNIAFCKQDIAETKPDAVIFIDFPGFNLKIVESVKTLGIKTFYYISPTVWAWKPKRALVVKAFVDHMFVVLPFVKDFYKNEFNHDVDYVGHPLLDSIAKSEKLHSSLHEFIVANALPDKKLIAVLPGSREAEIRENMKTMQKIAHNYPNHQFVIAGMSRFSKEHYESFITKNNVSVVFDQTYELLRFSDAAVVVSGSAILETAIIGTPQVLVYKTSIITWIVIKLMVKLQWAGLPNLIMNREIVPELLQLNFTSRKLKQQLDALLFDDVIKNRQQQDYLEMRNVLGGEGASKRTAALIAKYLKG